VQRRLTVRYGFARESLKREPVSAIDKAGYNIALATNRAHDWRLARISAPTCSAFLIPVPVLTTAT
jgi:hypothetical protein